MNCGTVQKAFFDQRLPEQSQDCPWLHTFYCLDNGDFSLFFRVFISSKLRRRHMLYS